MKGNLAAIGITLILNLLIIGLCIVIVEADGSSEKPVIVCTTNVLASIVEEFVQDEADVVVLVRPSLCPADYDMKPSDIYAVSKAKLLFYHSIPGEFWLQGLIESAENENLTLVKVPGTYNTPEGARRCVSLVGGNLSQALSINLETRIAEMLADINATVDEMTGEAETLGVSGVKVICMKWLEPFIEWLGLDVVATYDPPETLSAGDIAALVDIAQQEGVALIVDNLQISVEFGGGIASEVGAVHVVITNFPGAIPGTENLAQMFQYNSHQLFEGLRTWRSTRALRAEMESLKNQLTLLQSAASIAAIAAIVEAVWIYVGRKRR